MRFRGTLILFVLCAGMAAFIYFYEIRGGEERRRAEEAEERIWAVSSADISEMIIHTSGERIKVSRRQGGTWKITEPRPLAADSAEMDRLADAAAELKRESVVESEATDLGRFGLDPSGERVQIITADGDEWAIRFGKMNPTGSSTYAAVEGRDEVLLVANSAASAFRKSLLDLRNHSILSFDQYEAKSMELRHSGKVVRLTKESDRWWIDGEERWAADSSVVTSILGSLANGRLQEFFDEEGELENLGLENPRLEVLIRSGEDETTHRLLVGNDKKDILGVTGKQSPSSPEANASTESADRLYMARDASREELFFVDQELVNKLLKEPADLRDQSLAVFQRWDIDTIVLTNSQGSFEFFKSGGDWLFGEEEKKTRWDAVNAILDALDGDVVRFIDYPSVPSSYGLDAPVCRVQLKQGDQVKVDCGFGSVTEDGIFAGVRGESAVKIVAKEVLGDLDKGLTHFLEAEKSPGHDQEQPRER